MVDLATEYSINPFISYSTIDSHAYILFEKKNLFLKLDEISSIIFNTGISLGSIGELAEAARKILSQKNSETQIVSRINTFFHHEIFLRIQNSPSVVCNESRMRRYHDILDDLTRKKRIPLTTFVEVTYQCNERCIHCAIPNRNIGGLSVGEYQKIFEEIVKLNGLYVVFTGGEPFVRDDFIQIAKDARSRGLSVRIYTNGLAVTKEQLEKLLKLGVYEYDVSVYGATPQIHDQITGTDGSFKKTLNTIRAMERIGARVVVKCPVMTQNIHQLEQLYELFQHTDTTISFFPRITAQIDGATKPHECRMSSCELQQYYGYPFLKNNHHQRLSARRMRGQYACADLANTCSIDPIGNIRLCSQLDIVVGNLRNNDLTEIWKCSPIVEKLQTKTVNDLTQCSACDLYQFCENCIGLSLLEEGDINACSKEARRLAHACRDWHQHCIKQGVQK